jgi:hypothetical protein
MSVASAGWRTNHSAPGVGFVREVAFAGSVGAVPVRMYRYDANALAPTWSAFSL